MKRYIKLGWSVAGSCVRFVTWCIEGACIWFSVKVADWTMGPGETASAIRTAWGAFKDAAKK